MFNKVKNPSDKNVFRRAAALVVTFMLAVAMIPDVGIANAEMSVEDTVGSAAVGAAFDTDSEEMAVVDVVADCGADNTGNAMTNRQIQQALNIAKENSANGVMTKVIIPKGTYLISSALVVSSDTWIYCEDGAELKRCNSYGPMLMSEANGIGGYDGTKNVIVEGGIWNGNTDGWLSLADFSNIRFAHCRNILLKNMQVKNNQDGHHMEIGGAADVTIEGCTFTGYTGELKKEAIQLDCMNNSRVFEGYAPFDDTSCENIVIKNNLFSGICRGLGSHSATLGVYYTNIMIEGNTFENLDDIAMIMYNYKDCTITNNTIKNCASGIEFKAMSKLPNNNFNPPVNMTMKEAIDSVDADSNTVISSNTISVSADNAHGYTGGILLTGYELKDNGVIPDHDFRVAGVKISENRIESNGTTISLNDAENCTIESNVLITKRDGVNFNDKNGVMINGSDGIVLSDNYISGSAKSGMAFTASSGNVINGNTVTNVGSNGINIYSSSKNNSVNSNTVTSAKGHGIAVSTSSAADIKANDIAGSGATGISVYNHSAADCSGNKVTSVRNNGIAYSKYSSGKATSNTISGSGKNGIVSADHSSVTVSSNSISGSGSNGISVSSKSKATLKDNTVNSSKKSAVAKSSDSTLSLPKVTGVSAKSVSTTGVTLGYSGKSTNKCGYEVYRKTGAKGKYASVGTSSKDTFTDKKVQRNTTYYYKVRCYETVGGKKVYGGYSSEIKVKSAAKISVANAAVTVPNKVWTGKALKPAVTVKVGGKKLKSGTDYTVRYSSNKNIGTAKVTVTGKGSYTGKITKTFKINPQGQSISVKGDKSKKKISVVLKKHSSNSGYQVYYADNSGFKKGKSLWLSGSSKNKGTISSLKKGKTYYVRARDYKTVGKTNFYGKWSAVKKVSL